MEQLHHLTKKKAVKKYGGLLAGGKSRAQVENLMIEEEYSPDEITEILAAIDAPPEIKPAPAEIKAGEWDPKNPNAIIKNDINYENLVGEEFIRYNAILESLSPDGGYGEHTVHLFDFELYRATPIRKARYEGLPGTPIDFIGVKLRTVGNMMDPPINQTRITINNARELNSQILNQHSIEGHGKYYLLKKLK